LPGEVRFGTQGWVYPSWRGVFYPKGLKADRELSYYATRFDAVEVDSTFYARPPRERVERWREATPPGFVFSLKVPRAITHEAGLEGAEDEIARFLERVSVLGERLGPVVFQFPGSFRFGAERLERLASVLDRRPEGVSFAVEFRHRGWFNPEVLAALGEKRAAVVWSDHRAVPALDAPTGDFLYVRLLGDHDAPLPDFSAVRDERTGELRAWADRLRPHVAAGRRLFVFTNNHFEGHSPSTATRLRDLLGVAAPSLPFVDPEGTGEPGLFDGPG